MGENNRKDPGSEKTAKTPQRQDAPAADAMLQRDTSAVVAEDSYDLADEDREAIAAFDFRIRNVFVGFFAAMSALQVDINDPVALDKLKQYKMFFYERYNAALDVIPQLRASANPDVCALAELLEPSAQYLLQICGAVSYFESSPYIDYLQNTIDDNHKKMDALSTQIARNPAYRAYKKYIKDHNLEAGRTTANVRHSTKD